MPALPQAGTRDARSVPDGGPLAPQRAEENTESMQARATAIDRLVQEGDLSSVTFDVGAAAMDARFESMGTDPEVERQLEKLAEDLRPPVDQ